MEYMGRKYDKGSEYNGEREETETAIGGSRSRLDAHKRSARKAPKIM